MSRKIICDKCGKTDTNSSSLAPYPMGFHPIAFDGSRATERDLCDACYVPYQVIMARGEKHRDIRKWLNETKN